MPSILYERLPYLEVAREYMPYGVRHVTSTLGLLGFTALGFFMLLKQLDPHPGVSLDTDWFYRKGVALVLPPMNRALASIEGAVGQVYEVVMQLGVLGAGRGLREVDARVVDAAAVGVGTLTETLSGDLRTTVSGNAQYSGLIMAVGVLAALVFAVFGL
jgi:multicomponent Na+:H+ antiporter subunit D